MVLNNQIAAIIQDIASLNKKLKEYEDAINRGKIKKGDDRTNTYVQGSYTEPSVSISDGDSFAPRKDSVKQFSSTPRNHFESSSKNVKRNTQNKNQNVEGGQGDRCGCNLF